MQVHLHALQDGNWKYIDDTPPDGFPEDRLERLKDFEPQLYDLGKDPEETTNLIKTNPEMAKKLSEKLNGIRNAGSTR